MPSESVSTLSVASNGNASFTSKTVSLSSSVSALFPVPSESVSIVSLASKGNASSTSNTVSPSSSASAIIPNPMHASSQSLGIPLPSVSASPLRLIRGYSSAVSITESPSSSVSLLLPMPSKSVSTVSEASSGKASLGGIIL